MTVQVDVELTDAQKQQLEAIARHEEIPLGELIAKLVQSRLDDEARFRAAVQKGIDDIEQGRWIDHDEFVARRHRMREELLGRSRRR